MNEEMYGKQMSTVAIVENARMLQAQRVGDKESWQSNKGMAPEKLLAAARALFRKGSLTASDLAFILKIPQPNALALLFRLQRTGLATSELHNDARIRIFSACKTGN